MNSQTFLNKDNVTVTALCIGDYWQNNITFKTLIKIWLPLNMLKIYFL